MRELPDAALLEAELKRVKDKREFGRLVYNTVSSLIVVAAIAVLLSTLLLPVLRVTGESMTPTLTNDELVVCHRQGDLKRGEIVAFYHNNKILLKRVIGVAGDLVDVKNDGTVFVNGNKLDEPYIDSPSLGNCDIEMPYQVPDNRIFVMGDHRSVSIDSRTKEIGCVAEEMIVGKVLFVIYPFGDIKSL